MHYNYLIIYIIVYMYTYILYLYNYTPFQNWMKCLNYRRDFLKGMFSFSRTKWWNAQYFIVVAVVVPTLEYIEI